MDDNNQSKNKYDIAIVLCPEERSEDGTFPEYNQDGTYLGGQTRMAASAELCKANKSVEFIVVGGLDKKCKTIEDSEKTKGMKDYLIERCGKDIRVERVNSLPCTKHNFTAIFLRWEKQEADLNGKIVGVLTNFYHLPRSFKFLSQALRECRIKGNPIFVPIAAEAIICQSEVYIKSREYLLTLKEEVQGIQCIENGTYKDRCLFCKSEYKRGKFEDYEDIIKAQGKVLLSKADKSFLYERGIVL